jgi:hypothetical protein
MEFGSPDLDRIASLVDHRTEEPDIEYKAWMDLSSPENKAKLAKHLCALSNYGGGWLIFGVSDNGTYSEPHPSDLRNYSQDIINGIVFRYLEPAFHCNVYLVNSAVTRKQYPVVRVPPHGAQPVCAKSDGPLVDKQRVGVTRGTHYVRVPGPKSVPINTPELWRQILHRCVLSERDQLLSSISRLFEGPSVISTESPLNGFLDHVIARWDESQREGWTVDPKENRSALGFEFISADGEPLQPVALGSLAKAIRDASHAADAECEGFQSFDTYGGLSSPVVVLVDELEGYETVSVYHDDSYLFAPSVWCVLNSGIGAEVRPYHEDTNWIRDLVAERSSRKWQPGTRLSPRFQATRVYSFVAFVRHLASSFPTAKRVRFMADYNGLAGREIDDARIGLRYSRDRKSATKRRRTQIETTVESLLGEGASATAAALINPVLRLFDGWEVSGQFVRNAIKEF